MALTVTRDGHKLVKSVERYRRDYRPGDHHQDRAQPTGALRDPGGPARARVSPPPGYRRRPWPAATHRIPG